MLIMAERVTPPPHYNAGGIECIDALEAATSGLQGIEAFCTANAIKYLWRWKLKNGEEDLQKAVWYINRLIQRAGADSAAGKELFNMKMKRIANNVALQTIGYVISGFTNVYIYVRECGYQKRDIYRGLYKHFAHDEMNKYAYCKITELRADENVLYIGIEE